MPTTREKADTPRYIVRQFLRDGEGHVRTVPAGRFEPRLGEFLITERRSMRSASARKHVLATWLRDIQSRPAPVAVEGYESVSDALDAERGRLG